MANTLLTFSYSVLDALGVTANTPFYVSVDDTITLAASRAIWLALGTLLDGATDGKVTKGRMTILETQDPGWKDNAVALSKNIDAAILEFSLLNTTHQASAVVPAVKSTALSSGHLDINASGLKEFIYGCYHGFGASNAYKITNLTGNAPTGINRGFLGGRKHRKQQQSKTMTSGSSFVPPA